ncbi:MAG TPA: RNA polymerase sigma factor, partial [Gemmataceae bacterium]|nr:RNA polymerase sigma factor [Gemmataceae bacterium]
MANAELGLVLNHLRRLARPGPSAEQSDAELLEHFAARHEEEAFAAIVQRYGRLVLSVCRRVLRQEQDAEDAFQATFLVLARNAASIVRGAALAGWLHGVAYHTACRLKRSVTRRRNHENQATPMTSTNPSGELALRELQAILDEEVQRLPENYRAPFVLCCLEGHSKAEAARRLGCKDGTVSGRLARARAQLQKRLPRRGVSLSAALGAVALAETPSQAAVPALLAATT